MPIKGQKLFDALSTDEQQAFRAEFKSSKMFNEHVAMSFKSHGIFIKSAFSFTTSLKGHEYWVKIAQRQQIHKAYENSN